MVTPSPLQHSSDLPQVNHHSMLPCCGPPGDAIARIKIPQHLQSGLQPGDKCYFTGRLIGLNNPGIPTFECNVEDVTRIPHSRDFLTPTDPNKIYVEGLGKVIKREELKTEPAMKNPPIVCTVKHNDWDQAKQADVSFKVRYIIPPTTVAKSHALIQKGCEVSISGYLINDPASREPWLVQTTGVSVLKNPPRCRKKEMKIPKKINETGGKLGEESLPTPKLISEAACCCQVDRGEGSSSGSTPHRRILQSGCPANEIPQFSAVDIKGKGKERC
ncbi:hypothetical protein MJO29_004779 [Puccinia striiformis f. sp. tritici]|nr:hypothetical protein MJO29_004779 [Puccinia striiformis f. sp. tritici]